MLSFHRLSETIKVLSAQQRENALLAMMVICEMNAKGSISVKELQKW